MMDYLQAFAISASGMAVEKARVDLTAVNLANAQSTRSVDGVGVRPLRLVSAAKPGSSFPTLLAGAAGAPSLQGVQIVSIATLAAPPRLVYEPGHPDADDKGFVAYPGIDPVAEMVNMLTAVRAYEANVAALNAAKAMALRTLQIGG
jgi:flagellar basal-body rod protein FlgC